MSSQYANGAAAVVLDIGGVLLDWDPRYLFDRLIPDERERTWFLTYVCSPQWNRRQDEGRSWQAAVAEAVERHPAYEGWIRAYDERWIEMVGGLYEHTVAVLEALVASPTPAYALTNFSTGKWAVACDAFPALNAFEGVVVSADEGVAKPDPAIYRRLLDRYDLDPARTFFTDDIPANVDAARALGIDAERFTDAATLRAQLVGRGVLDG